MKGDCCVGEVEAPGGCWAMSVLTVDTELLEPCFKSDGCEGGTKAVCWPGAPPCCGSGCICGCLCCANVTLLPEADADSGTGTGTAGPTATASLPSANPTFAR